MTLTVFLALWGACLVGYYLLNGFAASRASGPAPEGNFLKELFWTAIIAGTLTLIGAGIGALLS